VAATLLSGAVADAATFTVTTTSDSGIGSLRNAITYANLYGLIFGGAPSTIVFQSGMSGTITLASALPTITAPITVAGPGALGLTVSGANQFEPFYIGYGLKSPSQIAGLTIVVVAVAVVPSTTTAPHSSLTSLMLVTPFASRSSLICTSSWK